MSKIGVGLISLLLVVSLSCNRKTLPGTNQTTITEAVDSVLLSELKKFKTAEFTPEYFQFKCKVDFTSQKMSESFSVNGRMKRDSAIWMSITPGLGIEVARCLIRKDSVFVLDRMNNKAYAYDFNFINEQFQTQLSYSNLEALILGNVPYEKEMRDRLLKQEEESLYLLRQHRGEQRIDNYVLTTILRLGRLDVLNKTDMSSLSVKYEDFKALDSKSQDSTRFANRVKSVTKMKDSTGIERTTTIDLEYTKTEVSTKPLNFPFNVPKRFENR